mgnify:CR=1 FL=1
MGRRGPAAGAWRGQRGRGGVPRGERSVWNLQRRLNENYHRLEMLREEVLAALEAAAPADSPIAPAEAGR